MPGDVQDPPVFVLVARDQHAIHFRGSAPPTVNPGEICGRTARRIPYVEDADALYAEYAADGVEFSRELANMPWHSRESVVMDCDGRLLAFRANL